MEASTVWEGVVASVPLVALRVLAWLLVGLAITLAGGLVGVIAGHARRPDHGLARGALR